MNLRTLGGLALCLALLPAQPALARGGGGCLEAGTLVATPGGAKAIEKLVPGDKVLAVVGGRTREATVLACTRVEPETYVELDIGGRIVRITPEHPVAVAAGPGVFRVAAALRPGDRLWRWDGQRLTAETLRAVHTVPATRPAYNLMVSPGGTFLAADVLVHNKGCFLPDTQILRADGSATRIGEVRPGDKLMAFTSAGELATAAVREVVTHEVDEYLVVTTASAVLRVTAEHPFYVGDGTFKTLEALKVGDAVFVYAAGAMRAEPIVGLQRVSGKVRVYNLVTDAPHTFFAQGVAVHNKGGGGGCFPAGTAIRTPDGERAIETLSPGDAVLAPTGDGRLVATRVESIRATRARLVLVETDRGTARTTLDHPFMLAGGDFRTAAELSGATDVRLLTWDGRQLAPARLLAVRETGEEATVYNLTVGPPHAFIAAGFAVHNKGGGGGGGFHGGGSHGGSSSGTPAEGAVVLFIFAVFGVIAIVIIANQLSKGGKADEDLDFTHSRRAIAPKAEKTAKLLEFIAKQDQAFSQEALVKLATATFLKLQECWQSRDYDPMRPLLMPDLYADHLGQIRGMVSNHEIDMIEDLAVERVDIVNVRYTHDPGQREFTALFTARAKDYYVDDRTREFLRGDESPAQFQEFWTFQFHESRWQLREIEQSRESEALKNENFFEPFTEQGLEGVYAGAGGQGPAGPWVPKEVDIKVSRIDRLLNFLVQTDKLWSREGMLSRAREVFLHLYLARESGDEKDLPAAELFPGILASLRDELARRKAAGEAVSFRNLCVRKVELVLVRNFRDNARDEFVVRIGAHAQQIHARNGRVLSQQEYVTPFEQYCTFGRLDNQWKLKEVLSAARGSGAVGQENFDEDSSPEQVQWYYRQPRAN